MSLKTPPLPFEVCRRGGRSSRVASATSSPKIDDAFVAAHLVT